MGEGDDVVKTILMITMAAFSTFSTFSTLSTLSTLSAGAQPAQVPTFRVDPAWPKPLPNHWIVGAVAGVAVDARDHVWITHRPSTLQPNETRSIWRAAPPVLEFDSDGTLLSSWGPVRDLDMNGLSSNMGFTSIRWTMSG